MKTSRVIPQNAQSFELLKAAGFTAEDLSPSPKAVTQGKAVEQVSPLAIFLALSQILAIEMAAQRHQAERIVADYVQARSRLHQYS